MSLPSVVTNDDNSLLLSVTNTCSREVFCSHLILLIKAVVSCQHDSTDMSYVIKKTGKKKIKQQQNKRRQRTLNTCKATKYSFKQLTQYIAKYKQERLIINFSSKKDTYKSKNLWQTKFDLHFSSFYLVCLLTYLSHESVHPLLSIFLLYLHFPTDINLVYTMQQFVQMTLKDNRLPL